MPGVTVNRLCGSGLQAVSRPRGSVRTDEAELLLAGGVEPMTRAPLVSLKPGGLRARRHDLEDSTLGWRFVNPRMRELHGTHSMGETAEVVAERYGVCREDQDAFALASHRRAVAVAEAGWCDDDPVRLARPAEGRSAHRHADEGPRPDAIAGAAGCPAPGLPRRAPP